MATCWVRLRAEDWRGQRTGRGDLELCRWATSTSKDRKRSRPSAEDMARLGVKDGASERAEEEGRKAPGPALASRSLETRETAQRRMRMREAGRVQTGVGRAGGSSLWLRSTQRDPGVQVIEACRRSRPHAQPLPQGRCGGTSAAGESSPWLPLPRV